MGGSEIVCWIKQITFLQLVTYNMKPRRCHAENNYANPCARITKPCARLSNPCARLSNPCARFSNPCVINSCARIAKPCARITKPCARITKPCARINNSCARITKSCARITSRAHGLARLNNYFPHGTVGAPYIHVAGCFIIYFIYTGVAHVRFSMQPLIIYTSTYYNTSSISRS